MTKPTLTHEQKFLSDFTAATEVWEANSWTWTECTGIDLISIIAADITATYLHGDIMQIELVCDNASTVEAGFYHYPDKHGANNLNFSTTTYPKFLLRYKTSASSAGAAAKVVLAFTGYDNAKSVDTNISDGNAQEILTNSYSTTWTTATGDITTGKTLDHILMFAECDTTTANGTYYVYYDFVMVHKDTFAFPFVAPGGVTLNLPKKLAQLQIPGRDGDILQNLGMASPRIHLEGNMDTGTAWGEPPGEYLYKILRGATGDYHDPWQWFTSDLVNCKVMPAPEGFKIRMVDEEGVVRRWSMDFLVYGLSSLGEADWDNLEWAGQ